MNEHATDSKAKQKPNSNWRKTQRNTLTVTSHLRFECFPPPPKSHRINAAVLQVQCMITHGGAFACVIRNATTLVWVRSSMWRKRERYYIYRNPKIHLTCNCGMRKHNAARTTQVSRTYGRYRVCVCECFSAFRSATIACTIAVYFRESPLDECTRVITIQSQTQTFFNTTEKDWVWDWIVVSERRFAARTGTSLHTEKRNEILSDEPAIACATSTDYRIRAQKTQRTSRRTNKRMKTHKRKRDENTKYKVNDETVCKTPYGTLLKRFVL